MGEIVEGKYIAMERRENGEEKNDEHRLKGRDLSPCIGGRERKDGTNSNKKVDIDKELKRKKNE